MWSKDLWQLRPPIARGRRVIAAACGALLGKRVVGGPALLFFVEGKTDRGRGPPAYSICLGLWGHS